MKLNTAKLNKYTDILLSILLIPLVVSSIALWSLPSGPGSGTAIFLGIGKHMWENLHGNIGWIFIALMGVHLLLHQKVIVNWMKLK